VVKKILKHIAALSPIALTKNEQYDRLTKKILKRVCTTESICIDIGANEGKVLQMMLQVARDAKHYAFEPIPVLFEKLKLKFQSKAHILNIALSNKVGKANFNLVLTDMAYSGLQKRAYDKPEKDTTIEVSTALLDNIIPTTTKIDLIKLDIEGGEYFALHGAIKTIHQSTPIILFEFGKAGANAYNITNEQMFQFITSQLNYEIYTLTGWLKKSASLDQKAFNAFFENNLEFFYLAAPKAL
jgi:FkbM family methyltransferase